MSSQRQTATLGIQQTSRNTSEGGGRDKLKNVDGDIPCMRLKKESIEDNAQKNESLKGRGGGRLKYDNVDGDMPLCLRKTEKGKAKAAAAAMKVKKTKSRMMSGSKDLCGVTARKRNNEKATNNDIVLQKNVRSMHSSERVEELVCELGGYRCDALLLFETWRHDKEEIWETHHKHIFMGAGKHDNKHGVGILLNKKWKQRTIDTEYINERTISTTILVNRQHIKLMSENFTHSGYADHQGKSEKTTSIPKQISKTSKVSAASQESNLQKKKCSVKRLRMNAE